MIHKSVNNACFLLLISLYDVTYSAKKKNNFVTSMVIVLDTSFFERKKEFKYLENTLTIKILFRKKLRKDSSHGSLLSFGADSFCFPICCPNI